jgi:hypothetical protein
LYKYLIIFFLFTCQIAAQEVYTLSGYIQDEASGETLIGANIVDSNKPSSGVSTNTYGYYSIQLEPGDHILTISYLGYQDLVISIHLEENTKRDFFLREGIAIKEVVITGEKEEAQKNVQGTQMGTIKLPVENIKKLPAIFGEVDILKAIQLLPGVMSSGEGNAGFYVRGGGPDQNLILLDEAVVYNTGHLLGFFSVFNADAIKNTTLIKGGLPAEYGGRLSSVLDIQMKEGNDKSFKAEGGIGLIASRLTVEGPIIPEKSSFIVSGRRTYALDLAQAAINNTDFAGTNYYFYDLNAKVNYKLSDKDRIYLSSYIGQDVLTFRQPARDFNFDLPYGNRTATLRYNRLFTEKLFSNISLIYNDYNFEIGGAQDNFSFELFSGVRDYNAKVDFDYYPNNQHKVKFGSNYIFHTLTPNTASASNGEVDFGNDFLPKRSHDLSFYIQDEWKVNNKLSINSGLRYTVFTQVGPYFSSLSGKSFDSNEPVITYDGLEPRLSTKYSISNSSSIKAGYAYTQQYLHLVSNSGTTLPTDLWVPSSDLVRPQQSHQYALGYFKNWQDDAYESSIEVYYKDLANQVDYADNYVTDITEEVERSFVTGVGRAYGAEFFLKKAKGDLNGWIGYTVSRSERSFDEIEGGRWYPAIYDRTHDLSLVVNYKLNRKWDFGGIFIYGTGRAFTPISGFYFLDGNLNTDFAPRNSSRLDDYHRMDISFTYTPNPDSSKKWRGSWTFSIYNVYNRKNPFFLDYDIDGDFREGQFNIEANKVTIFPIIPSITYNFKWAQNPK